jgi:uncharacterized protein YcnI
MIGVRKNTMRRTVAVPAVAVATLAATFAFAGAASAHVSVTPTTAAGDSYPTLTFRVPTESDTAATRRLAVYLPAGGSVGTPRVKPHPGWHADVTPTRVVWTADSPGSRIKPGEFDEFELSVGPLPTSGTLTFKALQYYTDGSVVRWIDTAAAGQPEPEHPAPVLTITPAASSTSADPASAHPVVERTGDSTAPLALSIAALVLAAGSLLLSLVRRRRS